MNHNMKIEGIEIDKENIKIEITFSFNKDTARIFNYLLSINKSKRNKEIKRIIQCYASSELERKKIIINHALDELEEKVKREVLSILSEEIAAKAKAETEAKAQGIS